MSIFKCSIPGDMEIVVMATNSLGGNGIDPKTALDGCGWLERTVWLVGWKVSISVAELS